jgi:hypothetical protein
VPDGGEGTDDALGRRARVGHPPLWGVPPVPSPVLPVLLGVLKCLGGPNSYAGHHHAALIAADGDFVLEHVSTQALQVPLMPDDLSPRAFSTYERLIASPPVCCRLPPPPPQSAGVSGTSLAGGGALLNSRPYPPLEGSSSEGGGPTPPPRR